MTVEYPTKQVARAGGWQGLDAPVQRRAVEQGSGVRAEMAGPYVIRWRNLAPPGYESEVIAEETVTLEPTGPLEGWSAAHYSVQGGAVLTVERDSPERELLRGFQCIIQAPGDEYVADDHLRDQTMFNLPSHKAKGEFMFPQDFSDAPEPKDLRDGEYPVFWTAWDTVEGEVRSIDVARDVLRVDRNQNIA